MASRSVDVTVTICPHISSVDNRNIDIVDFGLWYDLDVIINIVDRKVGL